LTENHSGKTIKRLRCDNGRAEFDNRQFQEFLKLNGISYEPSAPYTQHQNGVSERAVRTSVEHGRSMLIDARLPQRFWAKAINTAVFLKNRSPIKSSMAKLL
jgi:transposase